jgi:hypothetical protein
MKDIFSPAFPGAHPCGSDLKPRSAKAVVQLAIASRKRDDQVAIKSDATGRHNQVHRRRNRQSLRQSFQYQTSWRH